MAKSTLDFGHPFFQKAIKKHKNDPQFTEALDNIKLLIEANHEACHRVVQDGMGKYPQCHGKIWKYDWQPEGATSSTRKSWRLVAIVPDPTTTPYKIIAGALYPKSTTDQLSAKQLSQIYAEILVPRKVEEDAPEPQFVRIFCGEGAVQISVCSLCGIEAGKSQDADELTLNEQEHECIE